MRINFDQKVSTIFVLVKSVEDIFKALSSCPLVAKPLHLHEGHCRGKHLLIMMNFIAGGRCLHIEAIVLRNMLVHVR